MIRRAAPTVQPRQFQSFIAKLCAYRHALISAAVTGKIDVTTGRPYAGS